MAISSFSPVKTTLEYFKVIFFFRNDNRSFFVYWDKYPFVVTTEQTTHLKGFIFEANATMLPKKSVTTKIAIGSRTVIY